MLEQLQVGFQNFLSFFGNYPYLQALIVLCVSYFVAWILDRVVISSLKKLIAKTSAELDKQVIVLLHRPIFQSVILVGCAVAGLILKLPERLEQILFSLLVTFAVAIWSVCGFKVIRLMLRKMSRTAGHARMVHAQTLPVFENLTIVMVVGIAIYFIFSAWHIDMTAWLASAGIVGIAIGFAAKDTLANLFSGVFILADGPYKIGDFVVLDSGERGEVTHIGIRSTRLLTRDDIEVTVPNSVMGNTKIINESGGPHEKFRVRVQVGVAYGSDIDRVRELLTEIAVNADSVCKEPEPRVRLRMFGPSSLDFELLCWVDQPVLRGRILDTLNCTVYKRFLEEDIEIAYAKQDIYIKELPADKKLPANKKAAKTGPEEFSSKPPGAP
ncbi:MAG: mechanosensitive ion channel family protein [Gammaproteobacteria bacterium]|nr:mechanosensitive ion channel family protein [Gammaproteobacteria bacterium]